MNQLPPAETHLPPHHANAPGAAGNRSWRVGRAISPGFWALACALLAGLSSCSENNSRSRNSELRVDPPAATREVSATAASADAGRDSYAGPLPGAGRRYQVIVETVYFFDQPEQSTPNGRYLRRGDTFYGEGETNGFVKTGFVQPNGATGTAWLKVTELRKFPGSLAAGVASIARPRHAAAAPRARKSDGADRTAGTKTAVVQAARAYFYDSPDLVIPRKAYCERGDKVRLGESRGPAVYVTFINWEKVTTTGWMSKASLR